MVSGEVVTGGCHCGALKYRFVSPVPIAELPVRPCSCSFCVKHGGRYTSHPEGALRLEVSDPALLERYRFGHETADFLLCRHCGTLIAATCEIGGRLRGVLNINSAEQHDRFAPPAPPSRFDAEGRDDRISRRERNWIGEVLIVLDGPNPCPPSRSLND